MILGALGKQLPIEKLALLLPQRRSGAGAPGWVNAQGMIAMLFLQRYTQLSDRKFIDHFNGNWPRQVGADVLRYTTQYQ